MKINIIKTTFFLNYLKVQEAKNQGNKIIMF